MLPLVYGLLCASFENLYSNLTYFNNSLNAIRYCRIDKDNYLGLDNCLSSDGCLRREVNITFLVFS